MGASAKPQTILLVGASGTGKTEFVNRLSGAQFATGMSLGPCTTKSQHATAYINGQSVLLLDTPGTDGENGWDVNKEIGQHLRSLGSVDVIGIIYFHRIANNTINKDILGSYNAFKDLCGRRALGSAIVVTTMWDELSNPNQGESYAEELENRHYKDARAAGARFARHDRSLESAKGIVQMLLGRQPVRIRGQH
ncbi:hypothetical protein WOLCODRAFT_136110 [Wolfiporia cocos MD-104 SS10]|uniref:G domain-containing protein n=1 Tax=Wolfiporia cocos (strain MD-104) TaxID=742152 RepID=A0A2H3JEJ2_WOLCO|nr:hypothetical protein WOLCODRAFT_136110 [Wolfiporia cocos MD-104 SS10]